MIVGEARVEKLGGQNSAHGFAWASWLAVLKHFDEANFAEVAARIALEVRHDVSEAEE